MSRMQAYYDRFSQRWGFSLTGAVVYTSAYAFIFCLDLLQLHAHLEHRGEPFYIYSWSIFMLLGIVGVFHGIQVIRAVRRQCDN